MEEASERDLPPARRGPPRHFHAGPRPLQPALHLHELQSVFAFLKRADFPPVTQVSRDWLNAATTMPSLRWQVECSDERVQHSVLVSPLRKHVAALRYGPSLLSASLLLLISERMSHLKRLDCRLEAWTGMTTPWWPRTLEHLTLSVRFDGPFASLSTVVVRSLVRCAPNLTELDLQRARRRDRVLPYPTAFIQAIAEQLTHLQSLYLRGPVSSRALQSIRRMPHLTKLTSSDPGALDKLTAGPGPFPPLESIHFEDDEGVQYLVVDEDTLPMLLKLQSLRRVELSLCLDDPSPLIPLFSGLHDLELAIGPCKVDRLVAALKHCGSLTRFELQVDDDVDEITEASVSAILSGMVSLQKLALRAVGVRSLAFLPALVRLHAQLTHLELSACTLVISDIRYLRTLRSLRSLELRACFTSPPDALTIASLTPGDAGFASDWWPDLANMVYR
jgi:hypothetical protein